jgi:ABC-2 type transport system permease protein
MRMFLHELRSEQLVFWRGRESAVFVFIFPILLFLLLGTVYGGTYRGRDVSQYLTFGIVAYGVAATTFAGLTIMLVLRREYGILKRLRATPLPAWLYLTASVTSLLLVFALQATAIVVLGRVLYGAELPDDVLSLVLAYGWAAICFAGVGLGLAGLIRSGEGASAVVNVIALPMTFLSGGFGPTRDFPQFLQTIADALPLTYVVDLVVGIVYDGEAFWEQPGAIAVLGLWGAVGAFVAWRTFGWEPRER